MVDWIVALKEARSQYGSSTSSLNKGDGLQRSTSSTGISMESSKSNISSTQRTQSAITLNRGSIDTPLVVFWLSKQWHCQNQVKQGHLELFSNGKWKKRWYKVQGGILTELKNQVSQHCYNLLMQVECNSHFECSSLWMFVWEVFKTRIQKISKLYWNRYQFPLTYHSKSGNGARYARL